MQRIAVFGWLRVALGSLTAVALAFQAYRAAGHHALVDFFSYFTVLGNSAACVVLLLMGIGVLRGRDRAVPDMTRGAVTLYLFITGLVYQVLLSNLEDHQTIPWVNFVVHQLLPVATFVFWLLDPPKTRLAFRRTAIWLLFPLAYLVYSLIRGPLAGDWYPYPFLDPTGPGGYGRVAAECLGITAAFVTATWLITWLGNIRHEQARRRLTAAR